ncbi:MAG: PA2169 family four-helix-bundle protein [Thermoleophilia bacterium]
MSASVDERVAEKLVETLRDGQKGYDEAADRLGGAAPDVAQRLRAIGQQREAFADQIVSMGADYGDDVDDHGSIAGAAHRGWVTLKDAFTGVDPKPVLEECVRGDDHAIDAYQDAQREDGVSPGFRTLIQRQLDSVRAQRDDAQQLARQHG